MFYDKFKELCVQRRISVSRAATEIGLSNSTPTKWKNTGATPDIATLTKIADYFGMSIEEVLGNKKTPTPEGGRKIPHSTQREILAGKGIRLMLDADAKLTEAQLEDIVNFIEFQQEKNGR